MNVISTEYLIKKFGSQTALNNINFKMSEKSVCALLGQNGAGKTTFIKCLMNIIKLDGGDCEVLGKKSIKLNHKDFQKIGYISENQKLPEWMTIDELLDYCRPLYDKWDSELCENLLKRLDLNKSRNKFISQLSRGMKTKVSLISSIVYKPELIILDEPFTGVDILVRKEIIESILDVAAETSSSILISTHDIEVIENFADHIAILDNGILKISASLENIQEKYRKIEFLTEKELPLSKFKNWIDTEKSGRLASFIHTDYNEELLNDELYEFFPDFSNLKIEMLSLKEIFLALARRYRLNKNKIKG